MMMADEAVDGGDDDESTPKSRAGEVQADRLARGTGGGRPHCLGPRSSVRTLIGIWNVKLEARARNISTHKWILADDQLHHRASLVRAQIALRLAVPTLSRTRGRHHELFSHSNICRCDIYTCNQAGAHWRHHLLSGLGAQTNEQAS